MKKNGMKVMAMIGSAVVAVAAVVAAAPEFPHPASIPAAIT